MFENENENDNLDDNEDLFSEDYEPFDYDSDYYEGWWD